VPQAPGQSGDTPSAPSASKKSAAKQFPVPGEAAKPNPDGNTGSSSSSSSSGDEDAPIPGTTPDSGSSGGPDLKDKGSEGAQTGRHLLHRVNPVGTKLQSADEREAEDLSVAHFYIGSGDLQGAYLRSQDAVKTAPDDPDAHFALAEIALKLNKPDEAVAEYNACLKLDPTDKQAKESRKALAKLKPSSGLNRRS
jgi:tetratricopeptide (TPR) repeat protein